MSKLGKVLSLNFLIIGFAVSALIILVGSNSAVAAATFTQPQSPASNSSPTSLSTLPQQIGSNLNTYDFSGSSECYQNTQENPYIDVWMSKQGQNFPDYNSSVKVVSSGTTSIPLQLNNLVMFCHVPNPPSSENLDFYNCSMVGQSSFESNSIYGSSCVFGNGAPGNSYLYNNSLQQYYDYIQGVTVSATNSNTGKVISNAYVQGLGGTKTDINQSGARYWYSSTPFNLTFSPAITQDETVKLTFQEYKLNQWGTGWYCVQNAQVAPDQSISNSPTGGCPQSSDSMTLTLKVTSNWKLSGSSTVEVVGGGVSQSGPCTPYQTNVTAKPGSTVNFHDCITNNGPDSMDSPYYIEVTRYNSNGNYTNVTNGWVMEQSLAASSPGNVFQYTDANFVIPTKNPAAQYCEVVMYKPSVSGLSSGSPGYSESSLPACVNVNTSPTTCTGSSNCCTSGSNCCTGGSSGCAGQCPCENCHDPYLSTNNKLTISLPNGPYSNSSWQSSAPSSAIGAANGSSIYLYANPTGKFEINSSQDQYGSSQNRYPSDPNTSATQVPVASTLTPNTFQLAPTGLAASNSYILNLSALVNSYPYDNHDITITYYSQYKVSTYVSQQDGYYSCNGSIQTSPTCSVTYTYNGTLSPCTSYNSDGSCANPQTCTPSNATPPSCTYTRTETYSGIPQYSWALSSNSNDLSALGTYGPQQDSALNFPEVCPRNFKVQGPAYTRVTNVTLSPASSDQPTSVTVSTLTSVKFNVPRSPACETNNGTCSTCYNPAGVCLRHPYSVNLTYTGYYYIVPASNNSSIQPVGGTPFTINQFNVSYPTGKTSIDTLMASYDTTSVVPQYKSQLHTFTINPPATAQLNVGDQVCARFTLSYNQGGGNVNEYGGIWNGEVTNGTVYSGSSNSPVLLTVNNSTNNYYCSQPITDSPYTRLFGNDVLSGMTFSGSSISCNQSNSGLIGGNGETGPQATGTGSQFAALSLGQISNFTSAFLRTAIPTSTSGLTFANNNNSAGTYGGNFNIFGNCPTIFNYYEQKPQNATVEPTSYSIGNNTKQLVNDVLINTTGPNSPYILTVNGQINKTHVIYVNGNVYIGSTNRTDNNNSKVDYSSHVNYTRGNINSGNIPGLYVIALGNIYIGPNVSVLDGNYIAENRCDIPQNNCAPGSQFNPNNGGLINTCADINSIGNPSNPSAAFPQATLYPSCSNQLIIKGSLIAHDIKLERTYGSIRNSIKGENPLSNSPININSNSCTIGNVYNSPLAKTNYNTCAAEVFDFNPINYLSQPDFGTSQQTKYDSILSLPPVL